MRTIDEELTCDQFAGLGSQTMAQLLAAVEQDFGTWAVRLAEAAALGDAKAASRARHALCGLCSAFGAEALQQATTGPLLSRQEREALLAASHTTITAIRDAAKVLSGT